MLQRTLLSLCTALLCVACTTNHMPREMELETWQFSQDSIHWQTVTVPHDWAITGPFNKEHDIQRVAIEQNGETEATEKSGRSGALPWIGQGHYRTTFQIGSLPGFAELIFDGAMAEPQVYVNNQYVGGWAYGYNAFKLNITPFLRKGENTLYVHLQNVEESSRWYPGAGLYRPVKLRLSAESHIDTWSTFIYTHHITDAAAEMVLHTQMVNANGQPVKATVHDAQGQVVATIENCASITRFTLTNPHLWTPETPYLYTLHIALGSSDEQTLKFGVRTIEADNEKGFTLNGVPRKLQGVCLHHDLGPLGAAVNKAALIRQVKLLKEMGCDAIRTAHNMPSTMQMEVYDSLGMMVMAESFDMWIYPKCKNGYARFFKEWAERDIANLVFNHRNHPSLIMWSIGNEIPEQWSEEGVAWAKRLQNLCHALDPTRPVTQGMDRVDEALASGFAAVMDVPGLNYRVHKYHTAHAQLSSGFILGSETASTVSSRGIYKLPATIATNKAYNDGQCNGYDTEYCWWSNLPECDFLLQEDCAWTMGQFVWTGFDYLGEPTPYDEYWPSRSSYFGIFDLAGLPKDRYYLYRSVWNATSPTVHLLPHWNWEGHEGEPIPVYCYTNGAYGELFVNGKSQGKVYKDLSKTIAHLNPAKLADEPLLDRYRLRWNAVPYEAGELRVVVYNAQGEVLGQDVRYTAGPATALKLQADRTTIAADGKDLSYITVSLTDSNGNELPTATANITFEVTGQGTFRCVCNGDATSLESFTEPHMQLFSGKLVVTVQSTTQAGEITLKVTDTTHNLSATYAINTVK